MNGKIELKHTIVGILIACIFAFGGLRRVKDLSQIQNEVKAGQQAKTYYPVDVVSEWETVLMDASAYCPCTKCCDNWGTIPVSSGKRKTASGHTIKIGDKFVAAPRKYPFGTEMMIPGYNNGRIVKVEDVGGAIKGNKLDLYFDKHTEALQFGRQKIAVKVKISK